MEGFPNIADIEWMSTDEAAKAIEAVEEALSKLPSSEQLIAETGNDDRLAELYLFGGIVEIMSGYRRAEGSFMKQFKELRPKFFKETTNPAEALYQAVAQKPGFEDLDAEWAGQICQKAVLYYATLTGRQFATLSNLMGS